MAALGRRLLVGSGSHTLHRLGLARSPPPPPPPPHLVFFNSPLTTNTSNGKERAPRNDNTGAAPPPLSSPAADMVQFQAYVRLRLNEMKKKMPKQLDTTEAAELAFLEQQVVDDHLPKSVRKLRDPLKNVQLEEITHTNLPLLNRFVSESGAILPTKLTGVGARKQRALAKAIKRARVLALMPFIWKSPEYRHVSYTDEYSRPARKVRYRNDGFDDPPDLRYPGVQEVVSTPGLFGRSVSSLAEKRSSLFTAPAPANPAKRGQKAPPKPWKKKRK